MKDILSNKIAAIVSKPLMSKLHEKEFKLNKIQIINIIFFFLLNLSNNLIIRRHFFLNSKIYNTRNVQMYEVVFP